ncbi:exoribonuclease II [Mycoplasmopsis maculosa]|uniref:Ribonuclease R n=1 Tax=Mycoplasmopsis maculosa TaxID=114885 RepID=A0A449B4I6_9BACT|nr:ribonuclease R [Mycoplasmopsis maculosa]VEU75486.1 exoribonuclease II [Mycoplasmopsis maculosa]
MILEENKILEVIKRYPDISFLDIAKKLKIKPAQNKELTKILLKLIDSYLISSDIKKSLYYALEFITSVNGKIKFAGEGKFAFLDTDEIDNEGQPISYFIPNVYFKDAMNGDVVNINVYKRYNSEEKTFGVVNEILERGENKIIGVLDKVGEFLTFKPIEKHYKSLNFKIIDSIKEAKILDIVMAEIISYKNKYKEIKIIKKITNLEDPMAYVKSLKVSRNVPEGFEEDVIDYINENIPDDIYNENISNRLDLRNELIVTIDGSSTKDFDDAISVKKIDENNYELGVHIADVAYYVKEDSPLDKEALKRGTSIYLLDEVIPMLPFKLSNGICSLNPNEDRLTISCITKINKEGKSFDTKVIPTIIRSKHRLTYERVNEFIDNNLEFENKELNTLIKNSYELSQIIRKYKIDEGYIDFEIEEPKILLNNDGSVKDIVLRPTGKSEMMIEDFMVRANEEVAKFITNKKLPMMYRIHEIPDDEKIDYFLNVLRILNIKVDIDRKNITPLSFQKIVKTINAQKTDDFLKMLFLRTMQKAIYSPDNIGHFGLASECYCHFTSPIRRYPDVIVHRILWDFVFNDRSKKISEFSEKLSSIASMNSTSEQNAVQLERDTNDLKFAEFYKNKVGTMLNGQIFSITKFGVFVQFPNKTVSMVHVSNIGDGTFKSNEEGTELICESNTKLKYKLGQFVNVVIIGADETTGKVDAVFESNYQNYLEKQKAESQSKKK